MAEPDDDLKAFTAWKLDMIDAISIDPTVRPNEFRVAFRLIQHANSKTKSIFPAQDTIAAAIGSDTRTVRRCVKSLVQKGWIEATRSNRQQSNRYTFSDTKAEAMFDRRILLQERGKAKSDRTKLSSQKSSDRTEMSSPDRTKLSSPDRTEMSPEHLKGTPEGNDLNKRGIEEEASSTTSKVDGQGQASPSKAKALSPDLAAALDKIDPSKRHGTESAGDGSQPVPPGQSSPGKRPLANFNGRPVIPPDFDTLEIEQQEREAKRRRRMAAGQ